MGQRDDPVIPAPLQCISNGEYVPPPLPATVHEAVRRALAHAESTARRHGLDRRDFLRTLMGSATFLVALDVCSRESHRAADRNPRTTTTTTTTTPGGRYSVPPTATTDPDVAHATLTGDELIVDVQTHLLDLDASGVGASFARGFPYAVCGESDWKACFSHEHWLREVLGGSDTSVAVISAVPIIAQPNPLSIEVMEHARAVAERACGDHRVLLHGQVNPNVGDPAALHDSMATLAAQHPIAAWKVYTHVPSDRGWRLDDGGGAPVRCGRAFLDAVRVVGPRIVCVHKGFGYGSRWASPADIGPAAAAHRDITFVVYHSGYEPGHAEGPFVGGPSPNGVDRLIASLRNAGIGAGGNVYAELGSTWFNLIRDPDSAAHVLGKLIAALGADRVLWGTDSIWYGSPQPQIEAFRAFEISTELRDRFGYAALTADVKRKILGLNAARLYGIDTTRRARCAVPDTATLNSMRLSRPPSVPIGPRSAAEVRALFEAHGGL